MLKGRRPYSDGGLERVGLKLRQLKDGRWQLVLVLNSTATDPLGENRNLSGKPENAQVDAKNASWFVQMAEIALAEENESYFHKTPCLGLGGNCPPSVPDEDHPDGYTYIPFFTAK